MKKYTINLTYQNVNRDDNGFPHFGDDVVEIRSINLQYVYRKLDELYGKDNYHINKILESMVDSCS